MGIVNFSVKPSKEMMLISPIRWTSFFLMKNRFGAIVHSRISLVVLVDGRVEIIGF